MSGYNAFLENILMTGRIYQKSADGQTLKPVPVNKGAWEPGSYYYYDEVTRNGCLWLCTAGSTIGGAGRRIAGLDQTGG